MLELRDRKVQTEELEYIVTPPPDSYFTTDDLNVGYATRGGLRK